MAKATLKKVKSKRLFVFEHAAIEIETELSQEAIDLLTQIAEDMGNALGHFLSEAGVRHESELKPAKKKKYEQLVDAQARSLVRDDLIELLAELEADKIRAHFNEIYGEVLGAAKYKVFEQQLVTKALEFVHTP